MVLVAEVFGLVQVIAAAIEVKLVRQDEKVGGSRKGQILAFLGLMLI